MTVLITAAMLLMADAGPPVDRGQELVGAVLACGSVRPDERRLACYDRARVALGSALDDRAVAVIDGETVRRAQRSVFGFALPKLSIFGVGKADERRDEEVKEIRGVVDGVREVGPDRFEIQLKDDAVWKNIDGFRRVPQFGDTVTIVKAALGSYFMTIGNGRIGTRCVRVR